MSTAAHVAVPIRVHLAHAAVQYIADECGADLLHVKGPALDERLLRPTLTVGASAEGDAPARRRPRLSSDADVLVRPSHVVAFIEALRRHNWDVVAQFETGSIFEHAATLWNSHLGHVDVHRRFPGIRLDPAVAFENMWADRTIIEIAHRPCAVPSVDVQRLILLLHSARGGGPSHPDAFVWKDATQDERDRCQTLATAFDAEVALAAATGRLDEYADDPTASLWRIMAAGGVPNRLDEWIGRFRAASSFRERATVVRRALVVNTDHLAMQLGRRPTRREVFTHTFTRLGRLAHASEQVIRRRLERKKP